MSDPRRLSSSWSPLSSSPGSRPSPSSRPHFPWTTYSHQASRSSTSVLSLSTSATSTPAPTSQNLFDPRSSSGLGTPVSAARNNTILPYTAPTMQEEGMRHWNFTAFEWIVRDVHKLRDFVEGISVAGGPVEGTAVQEDFEILKEYPILGEGKFKLEIARTPPLETSDASDKVQAPTLSLFIMSLLTDYAHADYEMPASMMAAIKCQDDRAGERGARAEWVWEFWQNDWIFRHEREVWDCPLPSLSSLLATPRIMETDSFVICLQIHCPTGPFFPQQSSAYYVPRNLLDGLEASLDNANTGDIRFVCLERQEQQQPQSPSSPNTSTSRRSSSSCSHSPFHSHITARKRIIYAHSDILTSRSEYFSTMLASSFTENATIVGDRKLFTVVVEEADFITVYWLLKWVYATWVLFKQDDDPRAAVDGVGAGWSAKWLSSRRGAEEWDWKTFNKHMAVDDLSKDDAKSATSAGSARSGGERRGVKGKQSLPPATAPSGAKTVASSKTTPISQQNLSRPNPSSVSRRTSSSAGPGPAVGSSGVAIAIPDASAASPSRTKPLAIPVSMPSSHYPLSPLTQRHPSSVSLTADPHKHPTTQPPPASALSMYQVAHRYAMPGLAALAMEHIMSTITPRSSFALLLATAVWEELHSFVEDYIVEKWDEVSVSEEFEQCCQEVAGGEWGPEGGKTMMALFRRLRSPITPGFPRS